MRLYELYKFFFRLRHPAASERECREGFWQKRQRWGGNFVMELENGVKFYFDVKDELCYLIFVRDFEIAERAFAASFLRQGDVFLDIGANIGLFTVIAASRVGVKGQVHSFEPLEEPVNALKKNVALNHQEKQVRINAFGLSDRAGSQNVWYCEEGFSAFSSMGRPILEANAKMHSVLVNVDTLDRYVEAHSLGSIALIKMDVEGWERKVLEGASKTLSHQDPVILMEFTDSCASNAGSSTLEVREKLESLGYRLYRCDLAKKILTHDKTHRSYGYENLVACKSTKVIEERLGMKVL